MLGLRAGLHAQCGQTNIYVSRSEYNWSSPRKRLAFLALRQRQSPLVFGIAGGTALIDLIDRCT